MVGRVIDMRHIDRKELYTSLEARIQYLHSFLDFSSSMCLLPQNVDW